MVFEELMTAVNRWAVASEALAAVGAELTLMRKPESSDPEVVAALQAVSDAAGLRGFDELTPQQREMAIGFIRLCLHQSVDLIDAPQRTRGWAFTDPAILEGWGRGSAIIPGALVASAPEMAGVRSFLDVGTGVGLLAIAAARVWPEATIVGIDVWGPSLAAAAANISAADSRAGSQSATRTSSRLRTTACSTACGFRRSSQPRVSSRLPSPASFGPPDRVADWYSGGWRHPRIRSRAPPPRSGSFEPAGKDSPSSDSPAHSKEPDAATCECCPGKAPPPWNT